MFETIVEKVIEDRRTGTVILSLTQADGWDSPNVLAALQDRLNGYISVIRDGPLVQKYPQYQGRNYRIRLVCHEYPPPSVKQKLDRVTHDLSQLGIGFEIIQIKVATPQHVRAPLRKSIRSLVQWFRRSKD